MQSNIFEFFQGGAGLRKPLTQAPAKLCIRHLRLPSPPKKGGITGPLQSSAGSQCLFIDRTPFRRTEVKAEQDGRGTLKIIEHILTFNINSNDSCDVMGVFVNLWSSFHSVCVHETITLCILNMVFICQLYLCKIWRRKDGHKHWQACRKQCAAGVGGRSLDGVCFKVK